MWPAIKPRAVDDISNLAIHNERQHQRPVVRVIFEVGVLDDDDIARDMSEPGSYSGPFPTVAIVKKDCKPEASGVLQPRSGEVEFAVTVEVNAAPDPGCVREISPQPCGCSVTRVIIYNDYLLRHSRQNLRDFDEHLSDCANLIVDGHDDRKRSRSFQIGHHGLPGE